MIQTQYSSAALYLSHIERQHDLMVKCDFWSQNWNPLKFFSPHTSYVNLEYLLTPSVLEFSQMAYMNGQTGIELLLALFRAIVKCKIWVNYCLEFCQHDVLGPMEIRCKNDLNSVWRVFVRQCQLLQLVERTFFLRGGLSMLETYKDIEKRFAQRKSSKNIYTFIWILKFYYSYGENLYNNNFIAT